MREEPAGWQCICWESFLPKEIIDNERHLFKRTSLRGACGPSPGAPFWRIGPCSLPCFLLASHQTKKWCLRLHIWRLEEAGWAMLPDSSFLPWWPGLPACPHQWTGAQGMQGYGRITRQRWDLLSKASERHSDPYSREPTTPKPHLGGLKRDVERTERIFQVTYFIFLVSQWGIWMCYSCKYEDGTKTKSEQLWN